MEIVLPSDKHEQEALKASIQEIVDAHTRIAGEKTFIKEAVTNIAEKYELPKSFVSGLANWRFDESRKDKSIDKVETLEEGYNMLYNTAVKVEE